MDINFSRLTEALADRYGEREAFVHVERNRRFTFAEFHTLTNRIANMIHDSLGLKAGDCFINLLENDNLTLLHAPTVFKTGVKAAFSNYRDSLEAQLWQVDCCGAKVAFIENALIDTHFDALRDRGVTVVCMDPPNDSMPGLHSFWDLVEVASDANPDIVLDDRENITIIRFTGGTTGRGKPAMYTIDNWMGCKDSIYALPDADWNSDTRLLHLAPVSHGSALFLLPAFFAGGCNITINEPDLARYCDVIERERATTGVLVPTLLYRLLELPDAEKRDLSSFRTVFYGAAPMSPSKLEKLQERFGNIFVQVYGSTEHFSVGISLSKADHLAESAEQAKRLSAAGKVNPFVELIIVDDSGAPCTCGDIGEIWMRSRGTVKGYFKNAEKTSDEFQDGFWKSGDMAYKDSDGYVFIVDRKKDMIISGGFNVYATEVEAAINSHESVLMSAVVGVPHDEWGEAVHAEVVLRQGKDVTPAELISFVKADLGGYQAPKTLEIVESLPLSAVGKVLRKDVRAKYWQGRGRQVG